MNAEYEYYGTQSWLNAIVPRVCGAAHSCNPMQHMVVQHCNATRCNALQHTATGLVAYAHMSHAPRGNESRRKYT